MLLNPFLTGSAAAKDVNKPVTIAFIDSGYNPPWFYRKNVVPGVSIANNPLTPNPNDTTQTTNTSDEVLHGTDVTNAALNQLCKTQTCPDTRVLPIKVVEASGFASINAIAQGIAVAVEQGADIINISLAQDAKGSQADGQLVADAIKAARRTGVIVVMTAGKKTDKPNWMGKLSKNFALRVAALAAPIYGQAPQLSQDTGRGADWADIAAPGVYIPPDAIFYDQHQTSDDADIATNLETDGTSIATAAITAEIARLKIQRPDWGPARLTAQLVNNSVMSSLEVGCSCIPKFAQPVTTTVQLAGSGKGEVTINNESCREPAGKYSPGRVYFCKATHNQGESIDIRAKALPGSRFTGWQLTTGQRINCQKMTLSCAFRADSPKTLVATFTRR